jgi:crotonobetainyl-CoA:carnitine CoA-transferase CaiB-like acyl-CoA transferase
LEDPPVTEPRRPIVLSVEQALSMSSATLRFAHLGWRVIRVEATPAAGRRSSGDPNRYIGKKVAGEDRASYFVGPNCGKEAIALNLKEPEARELLRRLIRELPVDVFCTNTMPARHTALGLDYASLSAVRPELVWCSISALGLAHPDVPGYDPVLQAQLGYMDLTGNPDGPPMQNGPPIIDLKAGDECFAQVLLALYERTWTGRGKAIDVSMAQVAASWLLTFLPMLELGSTPDEIRRSGNEHRQFIPTNAYPTADGFIYMAVGSDAQWARLCEQPLFRSLARPELATNEGRRRAKPQLHAEIAAITSQHPAAQVAAALAEAHVPNAPITPIEQVMDLPFLEKSLLATRLPDGRRIRLPPPAVDTPYLDARSRELPFAPGYGEHTDRVLGEIGLDRARISALRERGIIA